MDYTQSDGAITHAGTGKKLHSDSTAIPTVLSDKDINSVLWSMMEVVLAAGKVPAQFDPNDSMTYRIFLESIEVLIANSSSKTEYSGTGLSGILIPLADITRMQFDRVAPKSSAAKLRWLGVKADGSHTDGTYYGHNAETDVNYGEIISRYSPTVPSGSVGFSGDFVAQRDETTGQVGCYSYYVQKRTGDAYMHHQTLSGTSPASGAVASILFYWDTGGDFTDDSKIWVM